MILFTIIRCSLTSLFFFFNDTATTEIYTLSLHDALPIFAHVQCRSDVGIRSLSFFHRIDGVASSRRDLLDRKSTRLNSSHLVISYAVFCLKKKNSTYASTAMQLLTSPSISTPASRCNTPD